MGPSISGAVQDKLFVAHRISGNVFYIQENIQAPIVEEPLFVDADIDGVAGVIPVDVQQVVVGYSSAVDIPVEPREETSEKGVDGSPDW